MHLVLVESPTKSKTLQKFLGPDYLVEASFGHVRDLPKKELGVDVEHNFKPKYVIIPRAKKRIKELNEKAQKTDTVILATDEDREGEAIAFHLGQALNLKNPQRIVFHEITKSTIKNALKNPRDIDMNLVDAQQTRRILDRLVGYKLSPLLWKKVAIGLSAGRVQSVAVRLIAERQQEIDAFKPQEYWSVEAELQKNKENFIAKLIKKDGKTIPKLGIKTKGEADKIVKDLKGAEYKIIDIQKKEVRKYPFPPLTTSTLQQEASYKLGFSAKKTMIIAQQLYEKGYITYHRTDSVNLSNEFLKQVKDFIEPKYLEIKKYKSKKSAQEAHEAIRPTKISRKIDNPLYELIWQRAIASQMKPVILDSVSVDIEAGHYLFRATGQQIKFDGFLKIHPLSISENLLPELSIGQILNLLKLTPSQHFTKPPAPYSEATLVKALEEYGIGRPSTYAPTLSTIQERNYVKKENKYLYPTEMGILINDLLTEHFPKIVDVKFTARMEEDLDKIAHGKQQWVPIIKNFYQPFEENLQKKYKEISKKEITEEKTDEVCEKCNKPMVIKIGRFGKFLACSGFPECKNTLPLEKEEELTDKTCPECEAQLKIRTSRFGKFFGCSNYPKCKYIEKYEN